MSVPALKDTSESELIDMGDSSANKGEESSLFDMGIEKTDLGQPDSLRYSILTWVLAERYDEAIEELSDFLTKPSDYPNFQSRVTRYIHHSTDLIYAIKAKRNFPGINSLTRAKQQELRDKFKEHFKELQYILKIVEKVQGDLRIQDARSTIYVVRAMWYSVFLVAALAFWLEITHGLAKTSYVVMDDVFGQFSTWLIDKIGL